MNLVLRNKRNPFAWIDDEFFGDFLKPAQESRWLPATDIVENQSDFLITVDVPGYKQDEIEVQFEDGILSLSGKKEAVTEEKEGSFIRKERTQGSFKRSFNVDSTVDVENVEASLSEGVLRLRLPKAESKKPRTIPIK